MPRMSSKTEVWRQHSSPDIGSGSRLTFSLAMGGMTEILSVSVVTAFSSSAIVLRATVLKATTPEPE